MGTRSGRRKEFGPSSSTGWTPSPPRSPEESRDQGNESGGEDGEVESISNIENHSGQEMRNETGMLNTTIQHAEDCCTGISNNTVYNKTDNSRNTDNSMKQTIQDR